MNGDPNQTSTKLRNAAVEIIKIKQRPLASHEIEAWIRENDKPLADLIAVKCSDYVRIILSVTQDSCVVKYKSLLPIPGVDKRSTFYGLIDGGYNPSEWIPVGAKANRIKRAAPKKVPNPIAPIPRSKIPIYIEFPDFDQPVIPQPTDDSVPYPDFIDDYKLETQNSNMTNDLVFKEQEFNLFDKSADYFLL